MVRHLIVVVGMVAAGCLVIPSESAAQASAGSLPAFRMPSVMISAGLGIANGTRGPDVASRKPMPTVSAQGVRKSVSDSDIEIGDRPGTDGLIANDQQAKGEGR
jgi:hypothetical protein